MEVLRLLALIVGGMLGLLALAYAVGFLVALGASRGWYHDEK